MSSCLFLHRHALVLARRHVDGGERRLVLGVADGRHDGRAVSEDDVDFLERSAHGLWVEEKDGNGDAYANARIHKVVLVATVDHVSVVVRSKEWAHVKHLH